jgi:hypothetical protein
VRRLSAQRNANLGAKLAQAQEALYVVDQPAKRKYETTMRSFTDVEGRAWVADVREEDTPRHHGRWYLVLRSADGGADYDLPEVRWQTRSSAERILDTMSTFELRRRLKTARARYASMDGASEFEGEGRGVDRPEPNISAG